MEHVMEAVEAELSRGGARAPDRLPPGARLLIDLARSGKCGEHAPDEGLAKVARATGEWNPDRASSDAFLDLAHALGNLSPDHGSNELCARAVAEAWRRTYPFRRGREGNPYDVLLPHPEGDGRAAVALDRARALPRPAVALARRGDLIEHVLGYSYDFDEDVAVEPFDRGAARALVEYASRLMEGLPRRLSSQPLQKLRRDTEIALGVARKWLDLDELAYEEGFTGHYMDGYSFSGQANASLDRKKKSKPEVRAEAERVVEAATAAKNALMYSYYHNEKSRGLLNGMRYAVEDVQSCEERTRKLNAQFGRSDDDPLWGTAHQCVSYREWLAENSAKLRRAFPDYYPDESASALSPAP